MDGSATVSLDGSATVSLNGSANSKRDSTFLPPRNALLDFAHKQETKTPNFSLFFTSLFQFFPLVFQMFLVDQKGENAQVLDTVKLPTCTHLDIKHDVTLRGGIKSGNFTKLGYLRDMQTCIDACCQDEKCDVAFMPGHVCYSVSCFSAKLCESIPAVPSIAANRSVRISHVVRGGGKGDDLEQFKKTQGMEKYSKRNVVILSSWCTVKSSRKKRDL